MFPALFCLQGNDFGEWRGFFPSLFYDNDAHMILYIYFQAICNVGPGYLTGQLRQEKWYIFHI